MYKKYIVIEQLLDTNDKAKKYLLNDDERLADYPR